MKNQMNPIYINRDIDLYINKLKSCVNDINDIFDKANVNMKRIEDSDVWRGKTSDVINEKYKLLSQNYETVSISLNKFLTLFTKICDGYEDLDKTISVAINDNIDYLSIK